MLYLNSMQYSLMIEIICLYNIRKVEKGVSHLEEPGQNLMIRSQFS